MAYWIARTLIKLIIRLTCRLEIHGLERLPKTGAFAVASNHLGRLDPLLVYYLLDRRDIIMLVAEKYRENALARWFVRQLDGIFVDRFEADFRAVRQALTACGLVVVLGCTRSPTALIEGHHGISYLAAKSGVPIYPVGITGTQDRAVLANFKRLRRARVVGVVGEPFTLPGISRQAREETLTAYTDEIMCRIAVLIPPEYRGIYAIIPGWQKCSIRVKVDHRKATT
jgi:1-acyl-sn-glycerol-3-phosphate acyltransferase